MPLGRKTPIGKPGWGSMLSVVDGGLTSIPWEDLDPTLVQAIQRESELFPPADANPHSLAQCRTLAQPSPEGEGHSPAPPSPAAADQIGPPGRQVTTGPPQPPPPTYSPRTCPPSSPL